MSNRGGMCTDTVLYLDERCSFQVDLVENEATITISGDSGSCHLVATSEVTGRLHTLLSELREQELRLSVEELREGARYTLVPRRPRIATPA